MPITDNFDSYSDGDLNGQGSWSGSVNFDIQGVVFQSSPKAVIHSTAASGVITKTGTAAKTGVQTVWGRTTNVTIDEMWEFRVGDGTTGSLMIVKTNAGNIQYFDGASYQTLGAVSVNTWFQLDIEWRQATNDWRVRLNGGTFTAFVGMNGTMSAAGATLVTLTKGTASAGTSYWDTLANGGVSGPTNLKSLDTNLKANIKSYNTNPIANIKSIDTNA